MHNNTLGPSVLFSLSLYAPAATKEINAKPQQNLPFFGFDTTFFTHKWNWTLWLAEKRRRPRWEARAMPNYFMQPPRILSKDLGFDHFL